MSEFDPRSFLQSCSTRPGVYRMLDADGQILYVGKARDLKARVSSYFRNQGLSAKTRALVARIAAIETTVTLSEAEALLLEQGLIKEHQPPYNILLRDDKSYPYIKLTMDDEFPRVAFHRGRRKRGDRYFGPFPSAGSVRESLALVEKVFRIRNCRDSFFRNRSRACLQHQIGRCTAPCVGLVTTEAYAAQVRAASDFLSGRDASLAERLAREMDAAAEQQNYERAAELRDQVAAIRQVQARQYADTGRGQADVVVLVMEGGVAIIEMLMVRQGRVLGNRHWKLDPRMGEPPEEVLGAFAAQYYLGGDASRVPAEVITEPALAGADALRDALTARFSQPVRFASRVRGDRAGWLQLARENARHTLSVQLGARESQERRRLQLARLLDGEEPPARIECFDISHTGGERAVASCVVFGPEGARKDEYRRFNVSPEKGGDDYAAMDEAVRRRYSRVQREQGVLPDLLLIDGGLGQVRRVATVLEELGLLDTVPLLGIAKGPSRKAGLEELVFADGRVVMPEADDPGLHLLQQVRDEAHRFAITGHRARRAKARNQSTVEEIPGVGPKKRKALLTWFGGMQRLRNASADEIAKVPGFSQALARQVYDWLHEG